MTKNVHDPAQSKIININYVQNTLGTRIYTHKQVHEASTWKRENAWRMMRHNVVMPVYAHSMWMVFAVYFAVLRVRWYNVIQWREIKC